MNDTDIETEPTTDEPVPSQDQGESPESRKRRHHTLAPRTPWVVGEPLPYQLSSAEMMRALNVNPGVFYKRQRSGKYKRFEFRNPAEPAKPYSGALVMAYLKAGK